MKRILQAALGITMAILGMTGWVILVKNNAQGNLAFIVCILCIVMFLTGLGTLADACGFEI